MRVEWAIPCRYAEANDGLATLVGAGIDTFFVPGLPMVVSMHIAVKIRYRDDEVGGEHVLVMRQLDAELNTLNELRVAFDIPEPDRRKTPGWEGAMVLTLIAQFEVSREGPLSFEIYADEAHQQTIPVSVRLVVPDAEE